MSQNSVHEVLDTQAGRHLLENAEERGYVEPAELEALALELDLGDEEMAEVTHELETIGLSPTAPLWRESLISCTGNQFCNLAVVETKQRAAEILQYLEEKVQIDTPIMVSVTGCPNSCAQYQISDIGLTGSSSVRSGVPKRWIGTKP